MKSLTLTIVIPAYNESRQLGLCLDSIAVQTKLPDEVIVVDNNSTDSTVDIARKYKFVRVINESKQGIVYARDAGFNQARSTIIGRIDADSVLPKDWVVKVLSFYADDQHKNYAWTSEGYFYNINFHKFNSWLLTQVAFRFNRFLLGHYVLWGSTMALPKSMWLNVRSSVCHRNDIHEDLDLSIHLHRQGVQITYDTSMKVAVMMRRVLSDRDRLWQYLQLWPHTLKVHNNKMWPLGSIGASVLYCMSPIASINKKIASLSRIRINLLGRIP